ncbi:hypothetical protein EIP86_009573 [Pleurotus ostreatoroseus]|nr:hypothetical protein EIP86_009573 [Pleurotus ostreatoroseus]
MSRDDTRRGRGFGARLVGFLHRSRSRSRSKKRRSQSLEPAPVSEMPVLSAPATASLGRRNVFLGLVHHPPPSPNAPGTKPTTRSPSRPLSGATTVTDSTARPYPYPQPRSPPAVPPKNTAPVPEEHHVHLHTEVLAPDPSSAPQKTKKASIFSVAISHPRRPSGDSGKSRPPSRAHTATPPTPSEKPHKGLWSSFRSGSRSGSQSSVGAQSSRSNVGEPSRSTPPPMPVPRFRQDTILGSPTDDNVQILNSPPPPYRREEFIAEVDEGMADVLDGRCSPLCGLPSPRLPPAAGPSVKGKERERARGARDRSGEGIHEKEKEKELKRLERTMSRTRRVGSPFQRDVERERRTPLTPLPPPAPMPIEKIASGSGSGGGASGLSRRSSTKESFMRSKRTKHGSFDFERPVSTNTGPAPNMRTALHGLGIGPSSDHHGHLHALAPPSQPQPLEKSFSAREPANTRAHAPSRAATHTAPKQSSSLPSASGRPASRPRLDVYAPPMRRGPTSTSRDTASPNPHPHAHAHPHPHPHPHAHTPSRAANTSGGTGGALTTTPSSSHSGHSSSLGRSAGGRAARTLHGAFRFEPAVPPIPGSPAGDARERDKRLAAQFTPSTTPVPFAARSDNVSGDGSGEKGWHERRGRAKGRSLDLGLSLAWAPQKVSEDAVREYNRPSSRASGSVARPTPRWKSERVRAVGEQGQLQARAAGMGAGMGASDVARAFREALGDAAYAIFKTYVHRYDAGAIPLDGPYGFLSHARRLLDNAATLDERRKQDLLERLRWIVRENQLE